MTQLNKELVQLEQELGVAARALLLSDVGMTAAYPARLDIQMRMTADRGRRQRGWLSFDLARGAAMRIGVAAALAIALSVMGGGVTLNDAPAADARQLVARILEANEAGSLTTVPPGLVRHVTVVITTIGGASAPVTYDEWFGDGGKSVRLAFADGTILTLADGVGWAYQPQQNVARRVSLDAKRFEALGLGTFALTSATVSGADARIVGPATALGRPATVVELSGKPIEQDESKQAAGVRMRYQVVVDDATSEIRESRAATLDSMGVVLDEVVTQVTLDELIDATRFSPDHFRFTPPAGTTVVAE